MEGRLEGRLEGRFEGRLESAAGVIKMFGVSIAQALESVGLPDSHEEELAAILREQGVEFRTEGMSENGR